MPRYAAVDVGSNSIRMLAAEAAAGSPATILAAERQVIRLGESVFRNGFLSEPAMREACEVLRRMAQIYSKLDVVGMRAVATSAVRDASNQAEFVERASEALGAPVEIISGQEEARLIHMGVQARWPHPGKRILIVDVGGGSAEVILSESGALAQAFSRPIGAVRLTEVFLKSDPPAVLELHRMEEYIEEKLSPAVRRIGPGPFHRVIATSATASAVVCAVNRISRLRRDAADRARATAAQVRALYRQVCARDLAGRRKLVGIGPRRAEIIVAGTAAFLRVLKDFGLSSLYHSAAGVRDGIIADLAGRGVGRDLARLDREQRRVVEAMARRFRVSLPHVRKVAALAQALFESLQPLHRLPPQCGKLLEAAAYLHDIGHFVSDTGHHKHSAYLVANSDMPGFTGQERRMVSVLCRYHRKSMPSARHDGFQSLDPETRRIIQLMIPLLRLADGLDRSHQQKVEGMECQIRDGGVQVRLRSEVDTDLEVWAGERVAEIFREVYQHPLTLIREGG